LSAKSTTRGESKKWGEKKENQKIRLAKKCVRKYGKTHRTHEETGQYEQHVRGSGVRKKETIDIYIHDQQMRGVKVGCEQAPHQWE